MFGKSVAIEQKTIAEKSSEALGMFHKAVVSLKEINNEADILLDQNDAKIKQLQQENDEISKAALGNSKIISNIEKLIKVG